MNNTLEMPTTFDFKPLEAVLLDYSPASLEKYLGQAMEMLVSLDQHEFLKMDIINTYHCLKQIQDSIREGGKLCQ